jgi:hypothetical protein
MAIDKGVLRGSKISSRHSTFTKDAQIVILAAKKESAVTKVVLSEIVSIKGGTRRLKFQKIPAGFKVTVCGASAQQILYIYTHDETVPDRITKEFGN